MYVAILKIPELGWRSIPQALELRLIIAVKPCQNQITFCLSGP